jgi:hypothetical protein
METWQDFLDIQDEMERASCLFPVPHASQVGWHFNLDGFVVLNIAPDPTSGAYCQLFRDGRIEAVSPRSSPAMARFPRWVGLPSRSGSPVNITANL